MGWFAGTCPKGTAWPDSTNGVAMSSQAYSMLDRLKRLGFKTPKEYLYES
jgi:hypothetical protein